MATCAICGEPMLTEWPHSHGASDTKLLVETLKEGLMILVRDGVIDEARADERARNQAQALICVFTIERHGQA